MRLVAQRLAHDAGEFAGRLQRAGGNDRARDAARLAFFAIGIEHIGNRLLVRRIEEIGGTLALLAHAHVERAVGREGEAAMRLVELHRRDADIHHHAVDLRDPRCRHDVEHFGEAVRVQHEARRIFARFGPGAPGGDRIGIAIEGMDRRAAFEQRAGIAAGAEGGVDHDVARLRVERLDHLVEEDGDMRGAGHLPPPFTDFALVSARKLSQAAFAPAQSSPIWASSSGFHRVKKRPPPWK